MKRRVEHENHDRWLVSYADFITLLFAFFVVLYASSNADREKTRQVAESVRAALSHGPLRAAVSSMLGHPRPGQARKGEETPAGVEKASSGPPAADLAQSLQVLRRGLSAELEAGKMQINLESRGLVVSMREAAFFASGDDRVSDASLPIIEKVARVILELPNGVRLEGHTDSVPIHNSRFRNNWELSAARAIAMLEVFEKHFLVPRERMAVAGYAETAPADNNGTAEGRAHNRRVDVVILTHAAMKVEPSQSAQPHSPEVSHR
jgi:chemotaxis protein MotB